MSSQVASISITLPDGSVRQYPAPVTGAEIAASIGPGLAKAAIAIKVNGEVQDLDAPIETDAEVAILTPKQPEGLQVLRHSCTHLMAQAVKRLHPEAMLEDGPATGEGFWYDIWTEKPLTPEEFPQIEKEMQNIVKESLPIKRKELPRDEALELFKERGEKYKQHIIENIPPDQTISTYQQGEFIDLCRGPHVPHTGVFKAFKLMNATGAYWKGDSRNDQLTRLKGTAFPSKQDLQEYLQMLEEAKKRDHRKLGKELELFMYHDWAPGETFWLPKGFTVYSIIRQMMSRLCREEGYVEVFTPMLFKKELFETSGHWKHFRDDMFVVPGQESEVLDDAQVAEWAGKLEAEARELDHEWKKIEARIAEAPDAAGRLGILLRDSPTIADRHWNIFQSPHGEFIHLTGSGHNIYALKPMNCPSHMLIFREKRRSYRELPLRIHDQGVLHRNEASGTLSGLTRVRQFCQDDAHVFTPHNLLESEITNLISMANRVYKAFDMEFSDVYLSTRPEDFLGEEKTWQEAEAALESALKANMMKYQINEGDGAFYGPKIDFYVRDCLGREWQTCTIQLDYQLPARFDLKFINADNEEEMPVVIHRALFGSFERFLGIIIEHFAGAFPTWLAPIQARVLTISEKHVEYGEKVLRELQDIGIRAEADFGAEKIGAKIREGRLQRIPYLLTVGEREAEEQTLSVRSQHQGDLGSIPLNDFLQRIGNEKNLAF